VGGGEEWVEREAYYSGFWRFLSKIAKVYTAKINTREKNFTYIYF